MSPRKTYILKLYVAGNTPNSMRALKTLRNILDTEFRGVYALKVIDVLKNPQLAEEDKILATPTVAKILPPPVRGSHRLGLRRGGADVNGCLAASATRST
jgi:circadian clock protein KaiB